MILYVIRHGQTNVNLKERINARNIIGLNKTGKEEARKASELIKNIDIDLIYCSPLRRTKQTCKLVNANNVSVVYDKSLLERDSKGKQFERVEKIDFDLWYDITKDTIYNDSEGFKSVYERVVLFLEKIKEKHVNETILLVTHGDVCKAINAYVNKLTDAKEIRALEQRNCEIRKYEI